MDGSCQWMSFTSSSSSSSSSHNGQAGAPWPPPPPKRPAGRTKFKETRHPVYHGVRRRGRAGRWVCEVRVPGTGSCNKKRGQRLWLGTYFSAECAARAHDAAMLMLRAAPGARVLNFPDSEWLLDVPIMALPAAADLSCVRRASVAAVADFQRREPAANGAAAVLDLDEAAVSWATTSSQLARANNNGGMLMFDFEVPVAAMGSDGMFELEDICGETDLDMYYTELAGGLLMEPPPDAGACWESRDAGADADLWSCY
ncbi:dehydration-responsive element-binding protein 1H [Brachypodium distachyon]|uniref:AP2/ERF domain-containing protein n=1 Tax=Brachypodium distachyon TaxID=15368 RepID=I1HAE1_BRADI|nr:dehydration-responsive element-binding protein 1H [Brachypodium distachyon]KQK23929.1 hypothetical protein BRADI_1g77120v3 [Brachypodium distachyon]|eukprot:XP_003562170.1 dehydration-responsive element-binding protein 1H [Brachypodium distachyon]